MKTCKRCVCSAPVRHTLQAVAFLLLLAAALRVLSGVFVSVPSSDSVKSMAANTVDVLFIGDSECMTSISPVQLWGKYGFSTFNCGLPSQRIEDTFRDLKQALQTQQPKVVFLETNQLFHDLGIMKEVQNGLEDEIEWIFPLYQNHNEWKNLLFPNHPESQTAGQTFMGWKYNITVKPYRNGKYTDQSGDVQKIGKLQQFYLKRMAQYCKARGIQLILFSAPSPVCWTYARHNGVQAFADQYGLTYLDLNLSMDGQINWIEDTYDKGDHLNFYGSKRVTEAVGAYMAENLSLTDHRGDDRYKSWDQVAENFRELSKENLQ